MEGENGFLVRVKDPAALAEAMARFIEQPQLIARMGERSLHLARTKYDSMEVARQVVDALGLVSARTLDIQ
jgi:glycosyltransferase involved in cell wall biosynthesis